MAVKAGSFTPNATGNLTVDNLTFLPTRLFFRVGAPTSSTDTTTTMRCDGWCTASNQSYDTIFEDASGRWSKAGTDKCIYTVKRSGTVVDGTVATWVDFHNNGGGNYGFTINLTSFDSGRQIRYMADDA